MTQYDVSVAPTTALRECIGSIETIKELVSRKLINYLNSTQDSIKYSASDNFLQDFLSMNPSAFSDIAELIQNNENNIPTYYFLDTLTKNNSKYTIQFLTFPGSDINFENGKRYHVLKFTILPPKY